MDVFLGRKGKRSFGHARRYPGPPFAETVSTGDLNGDRRTDVVAVGGAATKGTSLGGYEVLLGRPGGFSARGVKELPGSAGTFGGALGDLDRDGKLDLIVGRFNGRLDILRGRGNGRFGKPRVIGLPAGSDVRSITVARLNADKRPDLVLPQGEPDNVLVLLGKP